MSIKKHLTVVSFCLMVLTQNLYSQIILQGTVTDNGAEYLGSGAEPVVSALVTVTDQADTTRSFSGYTNEQGEYSIVIWATGVGDNNSNNPGRFNLQQNYPNPFNPSTVIGYELAKPANISIEIFDVLGRKIKTLFDGFQSNRVGQIVWDATNDLGQGVPAGVYVYSLKAEGVRINKKMLLIDGHRGSSNISMSQSRGTNVSRQAVLSKQMSDQYLLQVTGDDFEAYEQQNLEITGNMTKDITVNRTVTDIDGNVYRTGKIGDQWWMAENMKVTQYRNGDVIPIVTEDSTWAAITSGAYCNYNNDEGNVATYGHLYNWYAVNDSRRIAPEGWHVPGDDEWKELEMYLGMSQADADDDGLRGTDEGGKLKETGTIHWLSPNADATNESGFSALPGGSRSYGNYGGFYNMGFRTCFWSATEYDSNGAWIRLLHSHRSAVGRFHNDKRHGFSVRCLRDTGPPVTLNSIEIVPSTATLKNSEAQQFTCTATYSDQSTKNATAAATWSLSPGIAGSIDANGLFTAHATNSGVETVTASYQGQTDQATVNVFETGTVTDIDGNVYPTVKIGDQWWIEENLKVTHYRNGDPIPNVTGNSTWAGLTTGACCSFDNDANNATTYGLFYNWYAVDDSRNIAPAGWHVPTDEEWKELEMYLGMSQSEADATGNRGTDEGGKLKETGTTHWSSPNAGATNESGFSALPGGYRIPDGIYTNLGSYATFWSSTEYSSYTAWGRSLHYYHSDVNRSNYDKRYGLRVRLIRD